MTNPEIEIQNHSSITRRDFLRIGGVGLAGAGLFQSAVGNETESTTASLEYLGALAGNNRKIRVGIVGGRFGAQFQWHEHPNCIVEAVSDLRDDRCDFLAKVYKCNKTYPSLEEMVKDPAIEAIGIFTGAPDHVRHSILCLEHGKHVVCAVPVGMNVEECEQLLEVVKKTGLIYMMAETSWFHQSVITARQWYQEGKFGEIHYCESEYFHPGLEELYFEKDGSRSWRYGLAPMHYPTHCTGNLIGVSGERLVSVTCTGWGDDSQFLKDNAYNNPFWNETAMFQTEKGHAMRVAVWWKGPVGGGERADWYGEKMSFFNPTLNGLGPIVRRDPAAVEKDAAGFARKVVKYEKFDQPDHYKSDMLPEPLRHPTGHDSSHGFLTHAFIEALVLEKRPAIDIYDSLAMTVPGLVAHESAVQGGALLKIPQYVRPA